MAGKQLRGESSSRSSRRWEEMPLDCLASIFSRLGVDDLITAVPLVCKSWLCASTNPCCWRVIDFRQLDLNPSSPFSVRFSSQCSLPRFTFSGFLRLAVALSRRAALELRFSPLFPPSLELLSFASTECPRLKTLGLPRISIDDEARFFDLISMWKDLEWLEMESKPSELAEMAARIGLHCSNFHGLKLSGSIQKKDALSMVSSLPKLRFLDLSSCKMGKEELLAVVDGCRELKRLSVRDCVGFEADEEVKRRARGIEVFEHQGCGIRDWESGDALEQMFMYYDDCFELWML